jgi:hypothetical protein
MQTRVISLLVLVIVLFLILTPNGREKVKGFVGSVTGNGR